MLKILFIETGGYALKDLERFLDARGYFTMLALDMTDGLKVAMEMALTGNERNVVTQMDPDGEEMDALLHSMDSNDNGQVELVEFVRWWTQTEGGDATEKLNLWWFKDAIKRSHRRKHPPPAIAALVQPQPEQGGDLDLDDDSDEEDLKCLEVGVSGASMPDR